LSQTEPNDENYCSAEEIAASHLLRGESYTQLQTTNA